MMKLHIKTIFSLLVMTLGLSGLAQANLVEPKLNRDQLELGADVQKALTAYNPNFKLLELKNFSKEVAEMTSDKPMVALGDFNGDGLKDVVVYGIDSTKKKSLILAVISDNKKDYKVYPVVIEKLTEEDTFRNEQYVVSGSAKVLKASKRDSFSIEYFDGITGASNTYYFSLKEKKVNILLNGRKAD